MAISGCAIRNIAPAVANGCRVCIRVLSLCGSEEVVRCRSTQLLIT